MEAKKAIVRAIEAAGTQRNLAQTLGITDQAVSQWVKDGCVPLNRIKEVSRVTGVPVGDLLMDVASTLESE